ncbi:MAG: hypothetical protein ACKVX7_08580 [Planctomycetota bacterium]
MLLLSGQSARVGRLTLFIVGVCGTLDTALAHSRLAFVENRGQWSDAVLFVADCGDSGLRIEEDALVLWRWNSARTRASVVRLVFEGGSALTSASGLEPDTTMRNYFLGRDPARWRTCVRGYRVIELPELYAGIDLRLRFANGHPEYDLLIAAGAELATVRLRVDGAHDFCVMPDGTLRIETAAGVLEQPPPDAWQMDAIGACTPIGCEFRILDAHRFGFWGDAPAAGSALFVDPGLIWSTYLGGSAVDEFKGLRRLADGSCVAAGVVSSSDLEIPSGAFDVDFNGAFDVYVAHIAPQGAALISATYLGGSATDTGTGLAVDTATGDWLVTGFTWSPDFPVTGGAFDTTHGDPTSVLADAFVARLSAGGANLAWATYLGGADEDLGAKIESLPDGSALAIGTAGVGFPTLAGGFQPTLDGLNDGYVVRIAPTGDLLLAGTFFGGSGSDEFRALAIAPNGDVVVAGVTASSDLPVSVGAAMASSGDGAGPPLGDAFAARFNADLTQRLGASYCGGLGADSAFDAVALPNGHIVICGRTESADLPMPAAAFQPQLAGSFDAFLMEWNADLTAFVHGTYLGGSSYEQAFALSATATGIVTVSGTTSSASDFPITPLTAYSAVFAGATAFGGDIFVTRPNASMSRLLYSTYVGGGDADHTFGIAASGPQAVVVAGLSFGSGFPTTLGAYATAYAGGLTDSLLFELELPMPSFQRGDVNEDSLVTIADGVTMLSWLFGGGALYCRAAADLDAGGAVDLADPIALFTYLFLAGVPPAPPFPNCGADPSGLDCESSDCP